MLMKTNDKGTSGRVSLVGAGPGDPDLLTIKAARRLAQADVVVYDNLVGAGVLDLIPPEVERIYVGKEASNHSLPQDEITMLLIAQAKRGRRVVRLKGGDPFVFGRGGEELNTLVAAGVPVEVIPGITAALGASAGTGIPLTHRDYSQSCIFVTGHRKDGSYGLDWPTLARPFQTVVIYMGVGALAGIAEQLVAHGLAPSTPVALVRNATRSDQQTVVGTLADIADIAVRRKVQAPALIIVGGVVSLYDELVARGLQAVSAG
jgi:uroporphyrin-III C-methyltransferase/precorrin-2 dehydrogenase/sirohydrochlorin ferrochelatase